MGRKRMLTVGLFLLLLGIQALYVHADYEIGIYQLRLQHPELPYYNALIGATGIVMTTTPQLTTDYGSYKDVKTIVYQPFVLVNKRMGASLDFERFDTYIDAQGREVGSLIKVEVNYSTFSEDFSYRFMLQSYRGNYTGDYPTWSEVFAAAPGTTWSYTYDSTAYLNSSSFKDVLEFSVLITNEFNFIIATNSTNNRVILELEDYETKSTDAGVFECIRLKQSFYDKGNYTGHTYAYRTQIGKEYPLILQEDYNKEGTLVFKHELVSLSLPHLGIRSLDLLPGGTVVVIVVWKIQSRRK